VRHLLEQGARGLGLFGTASEGYTLSGDERLTLLRLVVREAGGRVPLVVSSGHTGTDAAVALSREAEAEGADVLMVLPPYFVRPDAEGIFEYYAAIDAAVRVPIMVQDAPLLTQVPISPGLVARMARELARVRYVKVEAPPTAPKMSEICREAGGAVVPFGGLNGQFLTEELGRGARGTMPGSDRVDAFVRIFDLWTAGRQREARRELARHLPLIRFELQPALGVSAMKHNLRAAGVIASARVRHPTRTLDAEGLRELAELRQDLAARSERSARDPGSDETS
jgi:4-hydroxy-tetrahydrodipicolinate synthase